jgi:hypothetical protein
MVLMIIQIITHSYYLTFFIHNSLSEENGQDLLIYLLLLLLFFCGNTISSNIKYS